MPFRLSHPESLPLSRAHLATAGGRLQAVLDLVLDADPRSVASLRTAIGAAQRLLPIPASGLGEPGIAGAAFVESAHNATVDVVFGIERFAAPDVAAVVRSMLDGYALLLDNTWRFGTALTPEAWERLRAAFDAYLRLLIPADAPRPPRPGRFDPPAAASELRGPDVAIDRWVNGHRVFLVLIQGLIVAFHCACDDMARADLDGAEAALRTATAVMLGSEAALRYTSDFRADVYEPVVRPIRCRPRPPASPAACTCATTSS